MLRTCCKKMLVPVASRLASRNFWSIPRPSDIRLMLRDMDHQMDNFEREMKMFKNFVPKAIHRALPIDAIETDSTYRISIDAAGFKPEDIKVSIKDRLLTVDAKLEKKSEDGSRFYQEMSRVYTLPDHVDGTKLKSLLTSDGILAIEAPISGEAYLPKEIPITRKEEIADK